MSAEIVIPYNVDERPDTGLYNAKLGIWLFLASEVMLFGALFSTYVLSLLFGLTLLRMRSLGQDDALASDSGATRAIARSTAGR